MSLKGSLETAALPEVLQFLASTGKTGELHVDGRTGGQGRLWLEAGCISGFDAGSSEEPFEAIFELLRLGEGEFSFTAGVDRPAAAKVADPDGWVVDKALEKAQARLAEWTEIVAVVPSMSHGVRLALEAPSDQVALSRSQWGVVVAIGDGRTVAEVLSEKGLREFEGCREIRDLVEASLVEVTDPAEAEVEPEPAPMPEPALTAVDETVVPDEPAAGEPASDVLTSGESAACESASDEPGTETAEDVTGESSVGIDADDFTTSHFPVLGGHESHSATADSAGEDDRYAALRAAMVDLGQDIDVAAPDGGDDVTEPEVPADRDGRAALQALLEEVAAEPVAEPYDTVVSSDPYAGLPAADPVDGLADRGPWTAHELAGLDALGGWREDSGAVTPAADEVPYQAYDQAGPAHGQDYTAQGQDYTAQDQDYADQDQDYTDHGPAGAIYEPATGGAASGYDQCDGYGHGYGQDAGYDAAAGYGQYQEGPAAEAVAEDPAEAPPAEEPINRGLLLKFLSSVRN